MTRSVAVSVCRSLPVAWEWPFTSHPEPWRMGAARFFFAGRVKNRQGERSGKGYPPPYPTVGGLGASRAPPAGSAGIISLIDWLEHTLRLKSIPIPPNHQWNFFNSNYPISTSFGIMLVREYDIEWLFKCPPHLFIVCAYLILGNFNTINILNSASSSHITMRRC